MFQRLVSVIVCIASIAKYQQQVHRILFFKEIIWWTYNQEIENYILNDGNFSLSFLNYLY